MTTARTNPFGQKIITKQLTSSQLAAGDIDLFTLTTPIQVVYLLGHVDLTFTGTAFTCHLEMIGDVDSGTQGFSDDITLTGLTTGTCIDFLNAFGTPPSGNPIAALAGFSGPYTSPGTIYGTFGGTYGAGTITFTLIYAPLQLGGIVTAV
jgi:hypothetical protein